MGNSSVGLQCVLHIVLLSLHRIFQYGLIVKWLSIFHILFYCLFYFNNGTITDFYQSSGTALSVHSAVNIKKMYLFLLYCCCHCIEYLPGLMRLLFHSQLNELISIFPKYNRHRWWIWLCFGESENLHHSWPLHSLLGHTCWTLLSCY